MRRAVPRPPLPGEVAERGGGGAGGIFGVGAVPGGRGVGEDGDEGLLGVEEPGEGDKD